MAADPIHRALTITCLAASSWTLHGCVAETDALASWDGSMRDSAGVTVVENFGEPAWEEGEGWTYTRVLQIGEPDGDTLYQFGRLTGAAILTDGTFAIYDQFTNNIRFFSPDGVFLAAVGREGSGPGEFAGWVDLLVGPGDTVVAIDRRTSQASQVTADGTWHGSFSILPQDGYYPGTWDDDIASGQIASLMRPMGGPAAPADDAMAFIVRRDLSGAFLDTLAWLSPQEFATSNGDGAPLLHYYRGRADFDLCNGSLITGHGSAYRFEWHGPGGVLQRIMRLDRPPIPLTDEDREALLGTVDRLGRARGAPPAAIDDRKARMRFEDTYPAWRRFVCGPGGSLLVARPRPVRDMSEDDLDTFGLGGARPPEGDWDVFDAQGRYLGVAGLPAAAHRHAFAQDADGHWLLMGFEWDDMDLPYIGVWRIDGVSD